VLDELDAPLDESNINRFVRVLQRFLERSQFIIITHNKRTIGMADILYGVTMEEHGVSKIVSVKFHKTQDGEALAESSAAEEPVSRETEPSAKPEPAMGAIMQN
jgi:chromosome segregation protein